MILKNKACERKLHSENPRGPLLVFGSRCTRMQALTFPKGPGLPPGWGEEEEKEDPEAPQVTGRLWLGDCPVFRTSWELPVS